MLIFELICLLQNVLEFAAVLVSHSFRLFHFLEIGFHWSMGSQGGGRDNPTGTRVSWKSSLPQNGHFLERLLADSSAAFFLRKLGGTVGKLSQAGEGKWQKKTWREQLTSLVAQLI